MAVNRITTQEALNQLAGFSGPLRTKQECMNSLAGSSGNTLSLGRATNIWCSTTGLLQQDALNIKAVTVGKTKQDAILNIDNIAV